MSVEISLSEKMYALSQRITKIKGSLETEEATKTSIILPFLQILGYDIFDPEIVVPEFTAEIANKKGEKVDYAIMKDGSPIILIEAKKLGEILDNHCNQLIRYFNVTKAKFAILTNGAEYRFFSDLDEINKMDGIPFLTLNLENLRDREIKELEKFQKENLDTENILAAASRQKNINAIKKTFQQETENPSDDFVRFFAKQATARNITASVLEEFRSCVKESLKNIITDMVKDDLDRALSKIKNSEPEKESVQDSADANNSIVTTEEEIESYHIFKSILSEITSPANIKYKDTKNYFNILYKGRPSKWIARVSIWQNVIFITLPADDKETVRIDLETLEDIYKHKTEIINVCMKYVNEEK